MTATPSATPAWTPSETLTPAPTVPAGAGTPGSNGNGSSFTLTLFNQAGEAVKVLALNQPVTGAVQGLSVQNPTFAPQVGQQAVIIVDGKTYLWNGANSNGQQVQTGVYYVMASIKDSNGNVTAYTQPLTVIAVPNQYSLKIFNSAGEVVQTLTVAAYGATQPTTLSADKSSAAIGPNGGGFTFSLGAGLPTVAWDGKDAEGNLVSSGTYTVQLVSQTAGNSVQVATTEVAVIATGGSVVDGAFAVPNPVGASSNGFDVFCPGAAAGSVIVGRMYDLAGELVLETNNSSMTTMIRFSFGSRPIAGGVYLIELTGTAPWGRVDHKTVKVVVIH